MKLDTEQVRRNIEHIFEDVAAMYGPVTVTEAIQRWCDTVTVSTDDSHWTYDELTNTIKITVRVQPSLPTIDIHLTRPEKSGSLTSTESKEETHE